jgi:ubiquinone/menaquinone biosynthesis C-methylase UbiE
MVERTLDMMGHMGNGCGMDRSDGANVDELKAQMLDEFASGRVAQALAVLRSNPAIAAWAADNLMDPSHEDAFAEKFFGLATQSNRAASEALADALDLRRGERVLEIGFGGGAALTRAGQALHARGGGRLAGVDLSPHCVEVARSALAALDLERVDVDLRVGSVTDIPFPDATFEAVFHINCWYFWPDLSGGLRECARVLRPGGAMLSGSKLQGMRDFFGERLDELRATRFRHTDLDVYEELAREAGFVAVSSALYNDGPDKPPNASFTLTRATRGSAS